LVRTATAIQYNLCVASRPAPANLRVLQAALFTTGGVPASLHLLLLLLAGQVPPVLPV
jgi:hypothetical protein